MRKIFASFIVFMLLSMFSSAVFAGQIDVCEDIKNDPAYKGLYGLCNAYWNADSDEARESILKAFKKKADPLGLTMPGLVSMDCPCWTGLTDDEICAMGDAVYYDEEDLGVFGGQLYLTNLESGISNVLTTFLLNQVDETYYCAHTQLGVSVPLEDFFIGESEALDCLSELEVMAMPDFCDL